VPEQSAEKGALNAMLGLGRGGALWADPITRKRIPWERGFGRGKGPSSGGAPQAVRLRSEAGKYGGQKV